MFAVSDVLIPLSGGAWILMVNQSKKVRRWTSVVGLLAQPFWTYTTFMNHQWGLFTLGMFYAIAWVHGFYNAWHGFYSAKNQKAKADDKAQ